MSPWRPAFEAALLLFARISEALARRGLPRPIPVGGAAEYYSGSAVTTGDFDLCSPVQEEMRRHGFVKRPAPANRRAAGFILI